MASVHKSPKSKYFFAVFKDANGKRRSKSTLQTDKDAAIAIASQWEKEAALVRAGVTTAEALNPLPLSQHLSSYLARLKLNGRTPQHIRSVDKLVCAYLTHAKLSSSLPSAATLGGVESFLSDANYRPSTRAKVISILRSFFSSVRSDPFLKPLKVSRKAMKRERKIHRRLILPEEIDVLNAYLRGTQSTPNVGGSNTGTAKVCGTLYGWTPSLRYFFYNTALQTGLRRSELLALKASDFVFDAPTPYVLATDVKNQDLHARQFLETEFAGELRKYVSSLPSKAYVFPKPCSSFAEMLPRMIRRDFQQAGLDPSDIDVHTLRHALCSWLAKSGASLKTCISISRHSSISLFCETYGHLFPQDEANAIQSVFGPRAAALRFSVDERRRSVTASDNGDDNGHADNGTADGE